MQHQVAFATLFFFRVHEARYYAPNPIVTGQLGQAKAKPER